MNIILIDPFAEKIYNIDVSEYKGIQLSLYYKLMKCDLIDAVRLPMSSDVMYIDDEGIYNNDDSVITRIFRAELETIYIRGRMIYLGTNEFADDASPKGTFKTWQFGTAKDDAVSDAMFRPIEYGKQVTCSLVTAKQGQSQHVSYEYEHLTLKEYEIQKDKI